MTKLPPGWEVASLGDLIGAGLFSDGDWVESKDQDPNGEVRLIQLADIGEGKFRNRSNRFLTAEAAQRLSCTYLEPGDVLVARMPDPLGRACTLPDLEQPCVTAVDVCILRPVPGGIDGRWLMWTINAPQIRSQMLALQSGTTRKRISRRNLATVRVPVPPSAEQQRIVATIEEYFSRLDAAEIQLAAAVRRLGSLERSSIMNTARTQDPPSDWQVVTVGEAGVVGLGLQRSPKRHSGPKMRPYLRVANVFEDRIDHSDVMSMDMSDAEWEKYRLNVGDVLLNEGQSPELLGRPAIYRGNPPNVAFTNSLIRFQAGPDVEPEWALLVFRSHMHSRRFMRESKITTNIAHLAAGRFKTVEFPVPPKEEQRARVTSARAALEKTSCLRAALDAGFARARSLRQSILSAAFTGNLLPQDPNDESASVLLDRIRSEHAAANVARKRKAVW